MLLFLVCNFLKYLIFGTGRRSARIYPKTYIKENIKENKLEKFTVMSYYLLIEKLEIIKAHGRATQILGVGRRRHRRRNAFELF